MRIWLLCCFIVMCFNVYRVVKKLTPFVLYALISSNIDRFSNLFHARIRRTFCNNTATNDPTTPQLCRYITLWNVSVLKATIENKTTSVTTHFKSASYGSKADTLNISGADPGICEREGAVPAAPISLPVFSPFPISFPPLSLRSRAS